tara:strand:+ start:2047 stop:3714 length:1668 start_codon:yes stop_codon:yes gene_type:complete
MTPVSPFFQHGSPDEQRLVQSLVDEHLQMFGMDVYYIPRKQIVTDDVLGEVQSSKFNDNYLIEAYLNNYEGYAKGSDVMTKFGINLQNEITLTISRERYEDFIAPFQFNSTSLTAARDGDIDFGTRPKEGDLIWFPYGERLFEIKHVEHESPFFQLGKNYTYELQCELYQIQDDIIDTNVAGIDERLSEEGFITTITLAGIGSTAKASVDTFALSGAMRMVTLNDDGSGYTSVPSISVSPSPAGVSTSLGAVVAITTTKGNLAAIDYVAITNPGFAYVEPPTIGFGTPGVGAAATSSLTNSGICSIRIQQPGSNYVSPPIVTIQHPQYVDKQYQFTGIATAGYSEIVGINTMANIAIGHTINFASVSGQVTLTGGGIVTSIGTNSIGIGASFGGTGTANPGTFVGTGAMVGSKAGQVQATAVATLSGSSMFRIYLTDAGEGYEATPTVSISAPLSTGIGTYHINERVVGSTSGAEAYVKSWNATTRQLEVSINTGDFYSGEYITGTASSARYQVFSYNDDLSDQAAGDEYFMNDEFETEADKLLDFTESNPFGDV